MPSTSFSVAMASSLCIQRKAFYTLSGSQIVVTDFGPDAFHPIRGDRCADAVTTDQDASLEVPRRHRTGQGNGKIRVVIIFVVDPVAEVQHLVASASQQHDELPSSHCGAPFLSDEVASGHVRQKPPWLLTGLRPALITCSAISSQ